MSWEKGKVFVLSVPFIPCVPIFLLPSKVFVYMQEAQDWLLMCWLLPFIVLKSLATPLYRIFHSFYIFFLVLPKDFLLQVPVPKFIFKGTNIIVLQMLGKFLEVKHMGVSAKLRRDRETLSCYLNKKYLHFQ